jgi:hypothetical protein
MNKFSTYNPFINRDKKLNRMTRISKYLLGIILMLFFSFAVIYSSFSKNPPIPDPGPGGGSGGGELPCKSHCRNSPGTCTFIYNGSPFCCDGWKKK